MEIKSINFENLPIRVVEDGKEKRMSAVDVCKALGYKNATQDWSKLKIRNKELVEEADITNLVTTDGKAYPTDTLDIEGVILLCMLAKTEKAKQFRKWAKTVLADRITDNVNKEIDPIEIAKQYIESETERRRLKSENKILHLENKKLDFELSVEKKAFENFLSSKSCFTVAEVAKQLPNCGRNRLFDYMKMLNLISKYNEPYQYSIEQGWLKCKTNSIVIGHDIEGEKIYSNKIQPLFTPKGAKYINDKWIKYDNGKDFVTVN